MGDASGRWFRFQCTKETVLCLEKTGLPEHLKQLPSLETPMYLQALLMDLEDSGEAMLSKISWDLNSKLVLTKETVGFLPTLPRCLVCECFSTNKVSSAPQVKVKLSHHPVTDGNISSEKPLIFLMDPAKDDEAGESGKKKRKKSKKAHDGPSAKNFGAKLSMDKIKASQKIIIGWRVRLLGKIKHHDAPSQISNFKIRSKNQHNLLDNEQVCMNNHHRFSIYFHLRLEGTGEGGKLITPIRPIACLAGQLEVEDGIIRIF